MSEPEPIWVKSKWTAAELDKQTIEFHIPLKIGGIAYGTGELRVSSRTRVDDRISIEIVIEQLVHPLKKHQVIFRVPERYVDRIERHPNQDIAKFRLMAS